MNDNYERCDVCGIDFPEVMLDEMPGFGDRVCLACRTRTKICTVCKVKYPAHERYFNNNKKGKYGLRSQCRGCHKKKQLHYYYKDHEERKQKMRDRYRRLREEGILDGESG